MSRLRRQDVTLVSAREAARRRHVRRPVASILLWCVVLLVLSFLFWADHAEIDEVTHAEGQVVPSQKTQKIQNLEGGILAELLIGEGDHVKKDQVLLRIDSTLHEANLKKNRGEFLMLQAEIIRMKAEVDQKVPVFPKEMIEENRVLVANQMALFEARKQELERDLSILKLQSTQKGQELVELQTRRDGLKNSVRLLTKELSLKQPLLADGAVSPTELLQLERLLSEKQSDLAITEQSIPRAKSAMVEAEDRINKAKLAFIRETLSGIDQRHARLENFQEVAASDEDRIRRTEVTAPMDGIVKRMFLNTIGGIIHPGETILEITPIEDALIIEAWVMPKDVAFLRPGLPGAVTITAYDRAIYGTLEATLISLSADTFEDKEKGVGRYRIQMRTTENGFVRFGEKLPIIPGMTASVELMTGKKTVLDYLLKPIWRAKYRAMRER
ncbi:MAG: HlyD family type I secretion periplasmic adaptor subunit [Magnetococcales bacterium]|nr:HlyD family type I secretion periplasmic adaptor subunit [Magnetococcales bacterium]